MATVEGERAASRVESTMKRVQTRSRAPQGTGCTRIRSPENVGRRNLAVVQDICQTESQTVKSCKASRMGIAAKRGGRPEVTLRKASRKKGAKRPAWVSQRHSADGRGFKRHNLEICTTDRCSRLKILITYTRGAGFSSHASLFSIVFMPAKWLPAAAEHFRRSPPAGSGRP